MAKSRGIWTQFEAKTLAGAEPWVMIRHRGGCFKLPAIALVGEVMTGVSEGWTMTTGRPKLGTATVRIALDDYLANWVGR